MASTVLSDVASDTDSLFGVRRNRGRRRRGRGGRGSAGELSAGEFSMESSHSAMDDDFQLSRRRMTQVCVDG